MATPERFRHTLEVNAMYIGGSIVLIAIGAILRYAVADVWPEVDLPMIGVILMVVGAIGLVVSLIQTLFWAGARDRVDVVERRGW